MSNPVSKETSVDIVLAYANIDIITTLPEL